MGAEEIERRLRRWPRGLAADHRSTIRQSLEACRDIFNSPRVVMAWEDPEEPWLIVVTLSEDGFTWREAQPEPFLPLVDPSMAEVAFHDSGKSISSNFRDATGLREVISAPIRGESVQGRIFIAEPKEVDEYSLILAELVGLLIERSMDYAVALRTSTREAVQEERIRVARDLHDGLLQSFTGVVLQLETIHSLMDKQPAEARRMITDIEGVIMGDQRELRAYVEQLRPRRRIVVPFDFQSRMDELRSRFHTQWGIGVSFEVERIDPLVAKSLGQETFRIIQEAVTNSAKHGAASHIVVRVSSSENTMKIEIVDDGSGFPFHGRMTLAAIRESGVGPAMLAERVAALNGDLAVESSGAGARVEISVPLGFAGTS
ncbi:MAG TPA: histidine kinase [Thermoanaerobaculia bacterium]|nr:histidine kinase [Thermoanaerobaculia bacterium]